MHQGDAVLKDMNADETTIFVSLLHGPTEPLQNLINLYTP